MIILDCPVGLGVTGVFTSREGRRWNIGGGLVVKLCLTLPISWTVAHEALLSMGFSRQEFWSKVAIFLLQGIFPTQGSNPGLLHCRQIFFFFLPSEPLGKPATEAT